MNQKHKPIRSFVKREGRTTAKQLRAMQMLWPKYGVSFDGKPLDLKLLFDRSAPYILEIGFGMGQSLLEMALAHPENNYLGIEVHGPGVGSLLAEIEAHQLSNLRLMQHDAVDILKQSITDGSLSKIQIFFPDPWHKKRHHKRRLIQPEFIRLLVQKLKPGGQLHLATDWENYAEQMMQVCSANADLINHAEEGGFIENKNLRPETKFERRGLRLGHGVWDLLFVKKV